MDAWDRSLFAMDPTDLLMEEAIRALIRVLDEGNVSRELRETITRSVIALRDSRV